MIRLIDITQDDINNGITNCNKCAIALALKREYKTDDVEVYVDGGDPVLKVNKYDLSMNSFMESDVLDFIFNFDNQDDIDYPSPKPFTLKVNEQIK